MGILASGALDRIFGSTGPAPLPGFLNSLAGPLDHYGYLAIALLLLLENMGIPVVPGEFAMIGGAIFAGSGRAGLNIVLVGVVAVVAATVGAEIGYLIGRFAGRELILRYGKYVLIKPHHLDRAQAIVDRYGGPVVIIARFIVGLREANGIIAGIAQMRLITFTIYNVVGACAWVATWVTIGYVAGDHIDTIYNDINRYSLYVFIAVAVLIVGYIGWRVLRRLRRGGKPAEGTGTQEDPETQKDSEAEMGSEAPEGSGTPEEAWAQDGARAHGVSGTQSDVGANPATGGQDLMETQESPETQEASGTLESPGNQGNSGRAGDSRSRGDSRSPGDSRNPDDAGMQQDAGIQHGPAESERSKTRGD
jgi:membrane protein DedA with SNARE-associated domain